MTDGVKIPGTEITPFALRALELLEECYKDYCRQDFLSPASSHIQDRLQKLLEKDFIDPEPTSSLIDNQTINKIMKDPKWPNFGERIAKLEEHINEEATASEECFRRIEVLEEILEPWRKTHRIAEEVRADERKKIINMLDGFNLIGSSKLVEEMD